MEEIKWHCPHCLYVAEGYAEETAEDAAGHLDAKHRVDVGAMDDEQIIALDDQLVHEIADMYADSMGGIPLGESHREFAKDILARIDEVRGQRGQELPAASPDVAPTGFAVVKHTAAGETVVDVQPTRVAAEQAAEIFRAGQARAAFNRDASFTVRPEGARDALGEAAER